MVIERKYIVDEDKRLVAVQLDIKTFNHIEEVLENFALANLIDDASDELLSLEEARSFYENEEKFESKI